MPAFDFQTRLDRARQEMKTQGVDCLLLSVGSDLPYLTGYRAMASERLTMLVLPRRGDATLVVPELEAPRVEPGPFQLRPWSETEDPGAIVAGLAGRPEVVAVGDQTWAMHLLDLFAHMTDSTFVPASRVTRKLRIRKEPAELQALRRAAATVDRVLARIPNEVSFEGNTERHVARRVTEMTLDEGGSEMLFHIVGSGPNAASPHHEPEDRILAAGDAVVIDFGARVAGYCSDVTRTFVVGDPGSDLVEVHGVVAEAQSAAREAVAPGAPASRVDGVARRVIGDAGYGEAFIHRTGHGIGLDVHEDPYLMATNRRPLEPGMVFSVEPGIYLSGRLGVRIEDIVAVTDDGVETLNQADRSLIQVS